MRGDVGWARQHCAAQKSKSDVAQEAAIAAKAKIKELEGTIEEEKARNSKNMDVQSGNVTKLVETKDKLESTLHKLQLRSEKLDKEAAQRALVEGQLADIQQKLSASQADVAMLSTDVSRLTIENGEFVELTTKLSNELTETLEKNYAEVAAAQQQQSQQRGFFARFAARFA